MGASWGNPQAKRSFGRGFDARSFMRRILASDARAARWAAALGAGIVMLAGGLLSAKLNIWIDESFTIHTTGAGPLVAWTRAIDFEAQPPFYFVLEAIWRMLDESSIAFARFPSVLCAALAVAALVIGTHRVTPRIPPIVVALVAASNPLVIWAASEMRVYGLVLFVGAILTWLFFEGFLVAPASRRARLWYAVFALVGLYTQYYVGFVLAAHFATLLLLRRRDIRAFIASMALVAVVFAPFVPVVLRHVRASSAFVTQVTFAHAAHEILNAVFVDVLPHELKWSGNEKIGGFAVAAALLIVLFVVGRPVVSDKPSRGVVMSWLICLVLFTALFTASGAPLDPARHLIVIAPMTTLVALLFVSSLTRKGAQCARLAVGVFAVFALGTLWTQYRPPVAKLGDWQRVAQLLSATGPPAPIAIFPAELALPLEQYLPAAMVAIPIPRPMPFVVDYVKVTTLTDEAEVARALDPVYSRSSRLWMVTSGLCTDVNLVYYNYNCGYLEAYLQRKYRIVKSIAFRGSLVRLYVRATDASSDVPLRHNAN